MHEMILWSRKRVLHELHETVSVRRMRQAGRWEKTNGSGGGTQPGRPNNNRLPPMHTRTRWLEKRSSFVFSGSVRWERQRAVWVFTRLICPRYLELCRWDMFDVLWCGRSYDSRLSIYCGHQMDVARCFPALSEHLILGFSHAGRDSTCLSACKSNSSVQSKYIDILV